MNCDQLHTQSKVSRNVTILNSRKTDFHSGYEINISGEITNQWRFQDFPDEGAPTPRGVVPTYDFAKFSQKLHEIERIWAPGGASLAPPLDPPLLIN